MFKIVKKEELCPGVFRFLIDAPKIAAKRKAGQFVIVRSHEEGERLPLTIADADPSAGTLTLVFQVLGKSTCILSEMKEGDSLANLAGPLGKPTHIENFGRVACLGGGIGVAPLYPIVQALKDAGNHVVTILGARCSDLLILEDEMCAASTQLEISTDDGSCGHHCFNCDVLKGLLDKGEKFDLVVAIGPVPMMKAVCNVTRPYGIKTVVSLNPIMIDATGMCGVCRVTVAGSRKFACVDGPEFEGHEVDFDELSMRLRTYHDQERAAYDEYVKSRKVTV